MNAKINIDNLVRSLLPWYQRTPNRLTLLGAMTAPLRSLWQLFDTWRDDTRRIINVTSQVAVLEGYLKAKYNEPVAIKLVTYEDGALDVGLDIEGEEVGVFMPQPDDALPPEVIPLDGEIREQFGDVDFIVYVPSGIDVESVTADIEKFRQALIKYKIIAN